MISFEAATVTAPDGATILEPTTLTLTEQRVSIIGANGSGESTLARLINGLIEPSAGAVTLTVGAASLDTVRHGPAARRAVGFVFTNPDAQLIMPTVVEDVELSLRRSIRVKGERREVALRALARFGLSDLAHRSVHALSGGQKQLVSLASVLAVEPAILVADEPTTLLDLRNARIIGDALMSLDQQLVLVTHDLDLAARADRTLVVDRGRVVFDGEPAAAIHHYREIAAA